MRYIFIILSIFISLSAVQKPLDKVSLQLQWLDQFQFAGYYMAKEKGFYEEAGLDVAIRKFAYETDTTEEVVSGRATYGIGRSSLVWLYAQGKDIILLSSAFQSTPSVLIALKSSNINSIKDFKNKTLMLTEDIVDTASIQVMTNSDKSVKNSVKLKKHTFDLEELIDGRVDLYSGYITNEPYTLSKRDIPYVLFSPKEIGFDFYSDILFTTQKEAQANPQRTKKFNEASLKGWKYAFDNIDEAVELIYKKYNPSNKTKDALRFEAIEFKKLAYVDNIALGYIEKKRVERILDVYRVMGLAYGNVDIDRLIFSDKEKLLSEEEENYLRQKKEILICVAPSSLPLSAIENGKFIGIGSNILNLTKENIKIPYELVHTKSWEESLQNIMDKKCDVLPIAKFFPEQKKIKYTTPYHHEPLVIVTSKSQNYILNIDSVLDKEFAVVKGSPCVEEIKKKYPDMKLNYVDSPKDGFRGVEKGEYYGYLDNLIAAAYAFEYIAKGNLQISGQFDDKVGLSFGVRDDDKILFNIFEKLSRNIKQTDMHNFFNQWTSIEYINSVKFAYLKEIVFLIVLIIFVFFYRQQLLKKKNIELEELKDKLLELNKTLELKVLEAVNEMQKRETYLLHKSRLAQMGEMISMIAHQWKQPLSAISTLHISMIMAIELEQYDLCDTKQREEFINFLNEKLTKIGLHTQNLSHIISDFGDFYRPNKYQEEIDLGDAVVQAYKLLEDSLSSANIDVRFELASVNRVMLYRNEFLQVILNIINNAKEQFKLKNTDNAQIMMKSYDKDEAAVLEISDNAGGISEDIIDNIFDPYFSTKFDINGTGLGLYMAKSIIEQHHGGKIYAQNVEDGVKFIIEIGTKRADEKK